MDFCSTRVYTSIVEGHNVVILIELAFIQTNIICTNSVHTSQKVTFRVHYQDQAVNAVLRNNTLNARSEKPKKKVGKIEGCYACKINMH